ncbi:MAG: glycoside hydrolase family 127 protein, partial [Clostridiales bacterium]|nr:glycoside hydrolase family 127 protein [Clostridiales bacterium]
MHLKRIVSAVLALIIALGSNSIVFAEDDEPARAGSQNYYSSQGELAESAFAELPLGAVIPREWLETQVLLQKVGLTGLMHTIPEYSTDSSAWLGATGGEHWERGTYYMRGLVALAFVLGDETLMAEAKQWVDWGVNNQRSDGYIGAPDSDWWARMPYIDAMIDYYEATEYAGEADERVISAIEKYFRYEDSNLTGLSSWGASRAADNVNQVLWLYNRKYDPSKPSDAAWLLALAKRIASYSDNWIDSFINTTTRAHVVNTTQAEKASPLFYLLDKAEATKNALRNGLLNISLDHGRIDLMPNADEGARDTSSTVGTETCAVVEALRSAEISERILGEAWIGDRIELLAYNSLPAATPPDQTGNTYFTLQNSVASTVGSYRFGNDHGDSDTFGAPAGFDCCFANHHMGWAKFVQTMWMSTSDDGLALTAYGPNDVRAKVADGKNAEFLQETEYPFKDSTKLTYYGETAEFPLKLRIPEWTEGATVTLNGTSLSGVVSGEYYSIPHLWQYGDVVEVNLPSEIKLSTWHNDSVAVTKGTLIFGLKIQEDWRISTEYSARELSDKNSAVTEAPLREVYPASDWNYGLVVNDGNPVTTQEQIASSFSVTYLDEVPLQPFSAETAPVTIKAKGQILPYWKRNENAAAPVPCGPQTYIAVRGRDIELIPYGSGRLRITHFPKIGDPSDTITRYASIDADSINFNGTGWLEFKNVVVPKADDYSLTVTGAGSGTVRINNRYEGALDLSSGSATIANLKSLASGAFQFKDINYNNIRFSTGLTVDRIEVSPQSKAVTAITASATHVGALVQVSTNVNTTETPWKVIYGTASGVYPNEWSVSKTNGSNIVSITGTDITQPLYLKVVAVINGVEVQSDEIVVPAESGTGITPREGQPVASYSGFGTVAQTSADWTEYDPADKIEIFDESGTRIRVTGGGESTRVKAALSTSGSETWTDYVAEANIHLHGFSGNNAG